jgi:hypothetical protein
MAKEFIKSLGIIALVYGCFALVGRSFNPLEWDAFIRCVAAVILFFTIANRFNL